MKSSPKVRVLVIDDSALMRKLIPTILSRDPAIEVVGTAMDGTFALKKIEEFKPDVVTLDLEMPRMDGMETLRHITRKHRLPVVVVSAHSVNGAAATFKALSLGAFDFVPKPVDASQAHLEAIAQQLVSKVKMAGKTGFHESKASIPENFRAQKPAKRVNRPPTKVVAIGISTGGPNSLEYLLSQLPAEFSGSILIVQHMPEGFTEMFAKRLNEGCAIEVKEARTGDMLLAGRALVCPGNRHMRVSHKALGDLVVLSDEERHNGHRPSVDVLFASVAKEIGSRGIGLLMTGMGEDGAESLRLIKDAGGLAVAQDEGSCVVFGMPRAAIERGHASRVVSLEAMANLLIRHCGTSTQEPTETAVGAEV